MEKKKTMRNKGGEVWLIIPGRNSYVGQGTMGGSNNKIKKANGQGRKALGRQNFRLRGGRPYYSQGGSTRVEVSGNRQRAPLKPEARGE